MMNLQTDEGGKTDQGFVLGPGGCQFVLFFGKTLQHHSASLNLE